MCHRLEEITPLVTGVKSYCIYITELVEEISPLDTGVKNLAVYIVQSG